MPRRVAVLAAALACCPASGWTAQASEPSYLPAMGAGERRALGTIRAEASVTASDGLEYDVVTVFQDHQRGRLPPSLP